VRSGMEVPTPTTAQWIVDVLTQRFRARAVALTDSGTSALVLALRMAAGEGGIVAFPSYVCVDLIAAARRAQVQVRLYDVDPRTLGPDLDSLQRTLTEGVDAVLVAHLYGLPVDVPAVRAVITPHGVPLIEDAAQHAGAKLHGDRAGMLGDLSVLSFGRGKGTTAGNGGAVLALSEQFASLVAMTSQRLPPSGRGMSDVVGATASWALGRPSLYGIPASIPALHLGETIYHVAHEPAALSLGGATLLRSTLGSVDRYTALRRRNAEALREVAGQARHVRACTPIVGSEPGYLRFPLVATGKTAPAPALGIVRGYPRPLSDEPELQSILRPTQGSFPGARELANSLLTLPTHHLVTPADLRALGAWLRAA
jgi:dTDP-4-amino-4,6-dideoxygalactose transaminase